MPTIGEIAFSLITSLIANAMTSLASYTALPFLQNIKIKRRVEIATAGVVEPLVPFLANEGIAEAHQELLFRVCVEELQPFVEHPEELFSGSLDGQKIFDSLYLNKGLPQAIRDERLENIYALLFPRVATLLCRIPAAVKDWEANAWAENFSRLDEIASELKHLFLRLDAVDGRLVDQGMGVLAVARRTLAQRVSMQVDLTGLRADTPIAGRMEDFFVHPELERNEDKGHGMQVVGSREESMSQFAQCGTLAIIYSDPGFGKSTWTRWLQKELLSSSWPGLAIRFELRQARVESLPSLHELIRQNVTVHIWADLTPQRIKEWVNDGSLLFLLDGFDEIAPGSRGPVTLWIEELRESVATCPIIVTSRPLTTNHLDGLPKEWVRWHIRAFDQPRILDYIRRWYAKVPLLIEGGDNQPPEQIARQLEGDPTIAPLTSNPLLLSTLLMVHHLDGSLPSGRAQLYRRYVDGMLGLWDARRKVQASGISLSVTEKKQILIALALHLQFTQQEQIDEGEAVEVTGNCLSDMHCAYSPHEVLATLLERTGLLVGPGSYCFVHKSVSEFLVAEATVQGSYTDTKGKRIDRFRLYEYRHDDRWNVVTFLWAGLAPVADVESFIEQCSTHRDIALGYGIFQDQYERFSPQVRRELMLRLLTLKPRLSLGQHFWITSGPRANRDDEALEIPSARLRGLAHSTFPTIFFRTVEDGLLKWSDSKGLSGLLRALLWMSVSTFSLDAPDWGECIRSIPAEIKNHKRWLFRLTNIAISRTLGRRPHSEAKEYLRVFCQYHPQYSGLLCIALLGHVLRFSRGESYRLDFKDSVLGLVPQLSWDNLPADLLSATRSWVSNDVDGSSQEVDLLDRALEVLRTWQEEPGLTGEALALAIEKVEGLQEARQGAGS